jgi:hypothetical protein
MNYYFATLKSPKKRPLSAPQVKLQKQKKNINQVTMNKNLGLIMSTKNINRNTSSTTTSQTITSRSTDLATTMPVANR